MSVSLQQSPKLSASSHTIISAKFRRHTAMGQKKDFSLE
jgi:hypothetical protein